MGARLQPWGVMAMSMLRNKFTNHGWFQLAASYLSSRFLAVEERLQTALRYVELHKDNRDTFSYEFASILRDSGSLFSSVADALVAGTKATTGHKYKFGDYRDFLLSEVPDIFRRTVTLRHCFPGGIVVPFEELRARAGVPAWWHAYNQVKHHEYDDFRKGNLENCVTAISALALLGHLMGVFVSDAMFVNVGIAYSDSSVDVSDERRLFPRRY